MEVGTILWAGNRADHQDHLHVEPPTRKTGTPPLTNPGMTPGVERIFLELVVEFGPTYYFHDPKPPGAGWSHMGWYNRRKIAGSQTWSQHAYANALDIGPYNGISEQQTFYDFLTGEGDDDMASSAQKMMVDLAFNGFPDFFKGDANVWYNLDEKDAQWDTHFRPALSKAAQQLWKERSTGPGAHTHNVIGKTT